MSDRSHDHFNDFKRDVHEGLSAKNKFLKSKYFYDERGSALFRRIMKLPEYYLTDCEKEIFSTHKHTITDHLLFDHKPFDMLEFGAGDGTKTRIILEQLIRKDASFSYIPIDISAESNATLYRRMKDNFPQLSIHPVNEEYFTALAELGKTGNMKVVLFLGANIGNFTPEEAESFFRKMAGLLTPGDKVLIGIDLIKDTDVVLPAYNDDSGVTKAFNLNLLTRINRELGGSFDLEKFDHSPSYDESTGAAKSFLTSLEKQEVEIRATGTTYQFDKNEHIFTEISQKFSRQMILDLADKTGFRIVRNFFDKREYFTDSLWELI